MKEIGGTYVDKVSVIIPVYNSEKYLEECIKSVCNQSYSHLEIIIVNDGSTDYSDQIIQKYKEIDERIHYIYKQNEGVSIARNTGIEHATGEYIVFVDSDDFIKEDMIANLVETKSDFSMCGYELYDDSSSIVCCQYRCNNLKGTIQDLANHISEYLVPPFLLGPCFKMFKTDIIKNCKLQFPPEISYGEDAVFVMEYLMKCSTVYTSSYVGYSYRKHSSSSLSNVFLINKIDINYRINNLIEQLLVRYNVSDYKIIVSDRLLNCFVSYTKELVHSKLVFKEKKKIFLQKYKVYSKGFSEPKRLAQKMVVYAGRYKICYPLIYLFKVNGWKNAFIGRKN